nr:deoxyuridine 5'-triphosphate nucleotidohydrolase-like [Hydra vulgaris]
MTLYEIPKRNVEENKGVKFRVISDGITLDAKQCNEWVEKFCKITLPKNECVELLDDDKIVTPVVASFSCYYQVGISIIWDHGITVLNSPGIIDSDYRGEIHVILLNTSNEAFTVSEGQAIAQMSFLLVFFAERVVLVGSNVNKLYQMEIQSMLSEKERNGGFGSTGH